jgi:hypothetical protein
MRQDENSNLAAFGELKVHKTLHAGERWFSVIDVAEVLGGMLGMAPTTKLHSDCYSQGIVPLKTDAENVWVVASSRTFKDIEAQSGQPVISAKNFKQLTSGAAKRRRKTGE